MADLYTKAMLTVIAITLIIIAIPQTKIAIEGPVTRKSVPTTDYICNSNLNPCYVKIINDQYDHINGLKVYVSNSFLRVRND